jgi:hypothetical protein
MPRLFFVSLLVLSSRLAFAQGYEKEYEKLYAWEVKQVDEFIERFNNDSTLLHLYVKKHDPKTALTHEKLVKSLFNAEDKTWNFAEISSFIKTVNDKKQKLRLAGSDFYATLVCPVKYKRKPETVILTLCLVELPKGGSKWVVTGADAKFIEPDSLKQQIAPPAENAGGTGLQPMSHATNFMNIDLIAKDKKNISNYYVTAEKQNAALAQFIKECYAGNIEEQSPTAVKYNVGQIKGWNMEIQQFDRQTQNSGWLISKLTKNTAK